MKNLILIVLAIISVGSIGSAQPNWPAGWPEDNDPPNSHSQYAQYS